MDILKCEVDEYKTYTSFLAANNGSFLQSWEWGEWQTHLGRAVRRYMVTPSFPSPLMSAQLISHPLFTDNYYSYCPYGPVLNTGYRVQGTGYSEALEEFIKESRTADTIFLRLEPQIHIFKDLEHTNLPTYQLTTNTQPGNTILQDITPDEEAIFKNIHSKTRYDIRLAQKNHVEVREIVSEEEIKLAAQMFYATLHRRSLTVQSPAYFEKFIQYFQKNATDNFRVKTLGAFYKNQLAAAATFVDFLHTRTYLYGGSNLTLKNVQAPSLLHWQAILDAKKNNMLSYDWFGGENSSGEIPGFVRFKLRFGGKIVEYPGARDLVFSPVKYKAYKLLRRLGRTLKRL